MSGYLTVPSIFKPTAWAWDIGAIIMTVAAVSVTIVPAMAFPLLDLLSFIRPLLIVVVPDDGCIKCGLYLMRVAAEVNLLSLDKALADALFNYLW